LQIPLKERIGVDWNPQDRLTLKITLIGVLVFYLKLKKCDEIGSTSFMIKLGSV
jgi:hypothetical protein